MSDATDEPRPSGCHWMWLPEEEVAVVLGLPDRASRIVAVAICVFPPVTVHLARGDGSVVVTTGADSPPCGTGVAPDLRKARATDYGLLVNFGSYAAAADAVIDGCKPVDLIAFDPADFDGSNPDESATPEQAALLDRAVAVLNRVGDGEFAPADREEWRAVIDGLRKTIPGLYGSEWIHRGWDLMLHGSKLFSDRWTPQLQYRRTAWWETFLARKNPPLVTERVPAAGPDVLSEWNARERVIGSRPIG